MYVPFMLLRLLRKKVSIYIYLGCWYRFITWILVFTYCLLQVTSEISCQFDVDERSDKLELNPRRLIEKLWLYFHERFRFVSEIAFWKCVAFSWTKIVYKCFLRYYGFEHWKDFSIFHLCSAQLLQIWVG